MSPQARPKTLALVGPTASGKSGIGLALARAWRGRAAVEIISMDSALVYRGMDIGTAKPSREERDEVPHHLIDIRDPDQPYSAAEFVKDTEQLISDIQSRGALPLLLGGTMMYLHALRAGLNDMPSADPKIREQLNARAAAQGWPALHEELRRVDPATAQRLAPLDSQRIQRALEVWMVTGKPLSSFHAQPRTPEPQRLGLEIISLEPQSRSWLHERIAQRFDTMLAQGFMDEMRRLRQCAGLHADLPSMRSVGYRQAWEALETSADPPMAPLRDRAIAATRQLAKRQLTWLRSMPERRVVVCDADHALQAVMEQAGTVWPCSA
ncbi:MAG: tRNA (adenosine(37)-N6)-dimethylallyltransferase MiaA [Betaproteobacteria bacterium]|nr:tRNA (adenosine(37)-N6)-dimethylallyltransferase MiaA [Betaproteobacteria bacterium]